MLFDKENQLSSAQAFTDVAAVSTNSYAKQTAAQDISMGRRMGLLLMPTVAGTGAATVEVIQATDAALTTSVDSLASVVVAVAGLALGKVAEVEIPSGSLTKKYIGARVTMAAGQTLTGDIYLVPIDEIARYKSFPKVVGSAL